MPPGTAFWNWIPPYRENRRSTPGAAGSIMETLPSRAISGEKMRSSVNRTVMALHSDRVRIRNRSKSSFETGSRYTENLLKTHTDLRFPASDYSGRTEPRESAPSPVYISTGPNATFYAKSTKNQYLSARLSSHRTALRPAARKNH